MADDKDDPFAKYTVQAPGSDKDDPFAKYTAGDSGPKPGLLESFGRGAVEGATFGFDDKLGMNKDARETSRKANPWVHFAGELLGGAVPMVAAAVLPTGVGQAAAAGRAAQLTGRGIGLAKAALTPGEIATWGQGARQGAKLGVTYGGLSGAGHADVKPEDPWADALTKRIAGAAKGVTLGALLGAPMGVAGHGIYRGGQFIGNLFADATAETAGGLTGASQGTTQGALVRATRKLEEDRIAPQQIIDAIRAEFPDATSVAGGPGAPLARRFWGPIDNKQPITADQVETAVRMSMAGESPAAISAALSPGGAGTGPGEQAVKTLLDELATRHLGPLNLVDRAAMVRPGAGDNTQMSMRAAAATPGEHVGVAREALLERQVGAQGRLGQLFDRILGSSDHEAVKAAHLAKLQDAGSRAYGTAFANEQPFNLAPIFMQWKAQFDKMRGVIPDTVRTRLDKMMWTETLSDGRTAQVPPQTLEGFMYAREGLRDLIGELPQGNNLRRHLTKLYGEMTDEVAKTNPAWKVANDIWRDGSAGTEALEAGVRMSTRLNASSRENLAVLVAAEEQAANATKQLLAATQAIRGKNARRAPNAQELEQATPEQRFAVEQAQARLDAAEAQQKLFKHGLARSLSDLLANQGETHDVTKRLLLPGAQKLLRRALGDDADQFFNAVRAEQAMARTYKAQFGSQTTPLREAVKESTWAPRFEASMLNPLTWLNPAIRFIHEHAARTINARRNKDLMGLYTETDPIRQLEALQAMQNLHRVRSQAGNIAGKPVVGIGSGAFPDAVIGGQSGQAQPAPIGARRP